MTLQELRDAVIYTKEKIVELNGAVKDISTFIEKADSMVKEENEFSESIDPDEFVAIQLSLYNTLKAEITTKLAELP